ncbi:glycosyltransferase family 2 protein [Leptolyngbya sp. FACHB-261]|uniref:glycosyltransferase family 2 protein n=1 Tax=Leptolyngbya sp. FACHB-261 TaxID=2692806 RepID=UPI001684539E|nr:glycosyltransferase family 2 protein [Leptolyngbya sp. FACHB-261]MBD2101746.1 glycosyltransferase family 2 protein [Leptolyngbya sp. FACHB-261]
MQNRPMIDIILPNLNKARFIKDCISSLKEQTFSDWRCVVIDGFSDDGSWEIIQESALQDKRFELHQLPKSGLYNSWNFGLSKVSSPYFCILTSDDVWEKDWLETAIQSLDEHESAICAAARTRILYEDSQPGGILSNNLIGERFFMTDSTSPQLRCGVTDSVAQYFLGSIYASVHSVVLRSSILETGGRFAEDLGNAADQDWFMKIGLHGDVVYHPGIEAMWRVYKGQATELKEQEQKGKAIREIHSRNRQLIAAKLGGFGKEFIAIAEEYDKRLLEYHFDRPNFTNLFLQPLTEFPKLLRIFSESPKALITDFLCKLSGKSYFLEGSLAVARLAHESMERSSNYLQSQDPDICSAS